MLSLAILLTALSAAFAAVAPITKLTLEADVPLIRHFPPHATSGSDLLVATQHGIHTNWDREVIGAQQPNISLLDVHQAKGGALHPRHKSALGSFGKHIIQKNWILHNSHHRQEPEADESEESEPPTVDSEAEEEDNAEESVHYFALYVVMPCSGVFLLCVTLAALLSRWRYTSFLPEGAIIVGVALFMGLVIRYRLQTGEYDLSSFEAINATLINLFLLPIIIFASGWTVQRGDFLAQIDYILIFAIFGTIISVVVFGLVIYKLSPYIGYNLGLRSSFLFGALISSTDPVSTLETYRKLGLAHDHSLLYIMVFGEYCLNDAAVIVLFEVINMNNLENFDYGFCALEMCKILFVSMGLGILMSSFLVLLMRFMNLEGHTLAEIIFLYFSSFFIFSLAEAVELSGVIAALVAGMFFKVYGSKHMTKKGKELATVFLQVSEHVADSAIFLLCGASFALIDTQFLIFGLCCTVVVLFARAVSVLACGIGTNTLKWLVKDPSSLTWKHQFMMWHGGLRGGVALVLALEINATWCTDKQAIVSATFMVIVLLLLVCGSTTEVLLRCLGLAVDSEEHDKHHKADLLHQVTQKKIGGGCMMRCLEFVHEWLVWLLVGDEEEVKARVDAEAEAVGDDEELGETTMSFDVAGSGGASRSRTVGRPPFIERQDSDDLGLLLEGDLAGGSSSGQNMLGSLDSIEEDGEDEEALTPRDPRDGEDEEAITPRDPREA